MDKNQKKMYVKEHLSDYLQQRGITIDKPFQCLNPSHEDTHPSMSLDHKRNKAHCFSCGADYDTFDVIEKEFGISEPAEIFNKGYEIFGLNSSGYIGTGVVIPAIPEPSIQLNSDTNLEKYIKTCSSRIRETDYFHQRGVSEEVIDRFSLGYDPSFTHGTGGYVWKAVIIPTGRESYTARNIDPSVDKKTRIRKSGESRIFNATALNSNKPIFIVEGEIDALSIITCGAEAVALGSTSNKDNFISFVKENKPSAPLILSLDNDVEGLRTSKILHDSLIPLGIPCFIHNISLDYNDPNEALVADKRGFIESIENAVHEIEKERIEKEAKELEEYQKNSAAAHLEKFIDGISKGVDTPCIPTGFYELDDALDGGLYEGFYVIGAISSLGKTTFMLQMIDQIAANGTDVLIFSLEMSRYELMAKCISRQSILIADNPSIAKTARGITSSKRYKKYKQEELDLIAKAQKAYGEYANRIFIHEGVGNIGVEHIRKQVEEHIRITKRNPVVLIDYLQILTPKELKATDKQNTDKSVIELKRISRDFKIPVFAVSSFNRENYKNPVSMTSFKESGAIEYSSDVLIGLQLEGTGTNNFDVEKAKKQDPRYIEAKIIKNRNGKTGVSIRYNYYPKFNHFEELNIDL
jgi:replicative DNA helicase